MPYSHEKLERPLPLKTTQALALRGEGFARCLRKRVLAFWEYVLRKYDLPPLPSTYEIAQKYFSDLWALPLLYLEGYVLT